MKAHWLMVIVVLILCVGLAFIACGDDDDDDDNDDSGDDGDFFDDDDYSDDDDGGDDDDDDDDDSSDDVLTDSSTSLMWQNDSGCCYNSDFHSAKDYCEDLILGGYDDWRMPSISELRSLIRGCDATETGGSCGVIDSCLGSSCWDTSCEGCSYENGPANGCYWLSELNGDCGNYWSSSEWDDEGWPWYIYFDSGEINHHEDDLHCHYVRCVRN